MKAAIYHGIRDIRVEEVQEPKPGPGDTKIRVKYCGICGSDLHEYQHGLFPESPFGHEACGEVVEVGSKVTGYRTGDRVIPLNKGAYAQYMVCPQERLLGILPGMSWNQAAVVEPLAVAAYSIEKAGLQPGITALITGAGPVGLMTILGLKAIGIEKIYVTEVSETRRKKAEEMGASLTCNPLKVKVSSWVKGVTSGRGVDAAFESVGIEASLKDCLTSVRFQGKVVVQGIFTDRVPIHMLGFVTREMNMIGTNSANPTLAMSWIEKKGVKPEMMVTKIIPLENISEGFEGLTKPIKEDIKILVEP
jgi:(R,R)-butanediol dehydrogenase / meso-butanediol dehydrogenase / diacetyl reductase